MCALCLMAGEEDMDDFEKEGGNGAKRLRLSKFSGTPSDKIYKDTQAIFRARHPEKPVFLHGFVTLMSKLLKNSRKTHVFQVFRRLLGLTKGGGPKSLLGNVKNVKNLRFFVVL